MLPRAIFDKSKLWPNGATLHVTFYRFTENDTLDVNLNAYIAKTISEKIAPYVNLTFVFHLEDNTTSGDIQIGYSSDANTHLMSIYGNKFGTDSLYTKNQANVVSLYLYKPAIAPSNITFLFQDVEYTTPVINQSGLPADYIGMSVLRNFCYALGMLNEIQNPVGMSLSFNVDSIVASFLQQYPTSSVTESMLRSFYSPVERSSVRGSPFDSTSIMAYTTQANNFLIQLSSYNTVLSSCDKYWLMKTYPKSVYYLPYGESLYSLQASCSDTTLTPVPGSGIGGFEWQEIQDRFQLQKAGTPVAEFSSTGTLTASSVKISQPPSATSQGSFLSLSPDGTLAVDSSIQGFKQDLVGVVNGIIDRVNTLQQNQTSSFTTLSGTVQDNGSLINNKLATYEENISNLLTQTQNTLTGYNELWSATEQKATQNRAHIDDLYLTQSTDRTNLTRYVDTSVGAVQTDLNTKNSAVTGRVSVIETVLPPVRNQLDALSSEMTNWSDIQSTTQQLQSELITNLADVSSRFDAFESLETKFSEDVLALNARITATLDSFQSIQAVITQNYNNLAGNVLPQFAKIELLKTDVNFLKASSYVLIAALAVIVIALLVYVFVSKNSSKEESK